MTEHDYLSLERDIWGGWLEWSDACSDDGRDPAFSCAPLGSLPAIFMCIGSTASSQLKGFVLQRHLRHQTLDILRCTALRYFVLVVGYHVHIVQYMSYSKLCWPLVKLVESEQEIYFQVHSFTLQQFDLIWVTSFVVTCSWYSHAWHGFKPKN